MWAIWEDNIKTYIKFGDDWSFIDFNLLFIGFNLWNIFLLFVVAADVDHTLLL